MLQESAIAGGTIRGVGFAGRIPGLLFLRTEGELLQLAFVSEHDGPLAGTGELTAANLAARFRAVLRQSVLWECTLVVMEERIDCCLPP